MSNKFSQPGGSYSIDPQTGKRSLVEQTKPREINRLNEVKKPVSQPIKKTAPKNSAQEKSKGDQQS